MKLQNLYLWHSFVQYRTARRKRALLIWHCDRLIENHGRTTGQVFRATKFEFENGGVVVLLSTRRVEIERRTRRQIGVRSRRRAQRISIGQPVPV